MRFVHNSDLERMEQSSTFEEMLDIALVILDRMPGEVGIVCGPISSGGFGDRDRNVEEFKKRVSLLEEAGVVLFNQMYFESHFWRIMRSSYYKGGTHHLMEVFYNDIMRHPKIKFAFFIPGWESSYGAKWEHRLLTQLNKVTYYLQ